MASGWCLRGLASLDTETLEAQEQTSLGRWLTFPEDVQEGFRDVIWSELERRTAARVPWKWAPALK